MIDLRSDTIPPSPAMRAAMAAALTGDELFAEDPTTRELEEYSAQLLGKEAGLFVPTGTLGNALALLCLGGSDGSVLLDRYSHVQRREMGHLGPLKHLHGTLYDSADGCPKDDPLHEWCDLQADGGVLTLETTHTWREGRPLPLERTARVCELARQAGAQSHLDGARLFNAAVALNVVPAMIVHPFTTVVFSLCKALGAPAGAVLTGPKKLIDEARAHRLLLGGTMRQTGNLAAAGLVALRSDWKGQLQQDHARTRRLAEGLQLQPENFPTNVVMFDVKPLGMSGLGFVNQALQAGIKVALLGPDLVRLSVHAGISDADVDHTIAALNDILNSRQRGHT